MMNPSSLPSSSSCPSSLLLFPKTLLMCVVDISRSRPYLDDLNGEDQGGCVSNIVSKFELDPTVNESIIIDSLGCCYFGRKLLLTTLFFFGNDRVTSLFYQDSDERNISEALDEIKMYYDCRYISSLEAAWRLFGYGIHFREPNVVRLGFYLPDKQSVIFQEGAVIEDVLDRPSSRCTMFTAWMEANKRYCKAKELTYAEFPKWFTWDAKQRDSRPRKKRNCIWQIILFRGCESYEDIRTFNGFVYPSFRDAYYARGLLDDDREYIDAIVEAVFGVPKTC
ncbi:hypothetical protein OROMI_009223 [Orobanche minor]